MTSPWKSFFLLKLPVAIVAVAGLVQLIAMGLAHVPLRRFDTDGLADAILADHDDHRVVMFGDSIARNGTRYFRVGDADTVLNLSTHMFFGLTGDMLLLRRYLGTHKPPEAVMIVASPSLFTQEPDTAHTEYYLWNVFRRPEERAYLRGHFPQIGADDRKPAIFNLQQAIVEPAMSMLVGGPPHYYTLGKEPVANPRLESASTNLADPESLAARLQQSTTLSTIQASELRELCGLAGQRGFRLDFVWAPEPTSITAYWRSTNAVSRLQDEMLRAMDNGCPTPGFTNFNAYTTFLAFDHQARHVRGEGWQELFTYMLKVHVDILLKTLRSLGGSGAAAANERSTGPSSVAVVAGSVAPRSD